MNQRQHQQIKVTFRYNQVNNYLMAVGKSKYIFFQSDLALIYITLHLARIYITDLELRFALPFNGEIESFSLSQVSSHNSFSVESGNTQTGEARVQDCMYRNHLRHKHAILRSFKTKPTKNRLGPGLTSSFGPFYGPV